MHTTLPLKYRPQILADLVGQETIATTLRNAIGTSKIAPAYLFTGSRGTGKTSTARILAKSLNCSSSNTPTVSPCGKCQSCRSIEKGTSIDVSEIDAASHNGVDDARELIERSNFAPAMGRYRIFILDECHCLSQQAFNALLKCLEEPPPKTVFILCTTEEHKVLTTVTSRCQVFNFRNLAVATIVNRLQEVAQKEDIQIAQEALTAIAREAEGGLRNALQMLDQLSLVGCKITKSHVLELSGSINESDLVSIITALKAGDAMSLLKLSRELIDNGKTPKVLLTSLLQIYRDLLLAVTIPNCEGLTTSAVSYSNLQSISFSWDYDDLETGFEQLRTSEFQLKSSVNPSLWLEVCLLGLITSKPSTDRSIQNGTAPKDSRRIGNGTDASKGKKQKTNHDSPKAHMTLTSSLNHNEIWNKVILNASGKNRELLSKAQLITFEKGTAVLAVPTKYLSLFTKNVSKLQKMLACTTGTNLSLSIEEKKLLPTVNSSSRKK